jgi:hypothetical protein
MIAEFSLVAGTLASLLHVLTGPDHLAAVTPFVIESEKKAWKIGLAWGLGHIVGMASIGFLFLVFKDLIPVERISNYSEQLVGIVLIGIGIWAFYRIFSGKKPHHHVHIHRMIRPVDNSQSNVLQQSDYASFSVGVLHGLAGIAHFLLFFPVLGFKNQIDSILYVIGSCLGILIAMTAFAFVIGKLTTLFKNENDPVFLNGIRLISGLIALIIGVYWLLYN